jgi:hypothetical protein
MNNLDGMYYMIDIYCFGFFFSSLIKWNRLEKQTTHDEHSVRYENQNRRFSEENIISQTGFETLV